MLLSFNCNGEDVEVQISADSTMAEVLRDGLGLTGTKVGCGTGDCGACTVILDDKAVCSCIVPAPKCDGARVQTVEGVVRTTLGKTIVEQFAKSHAVQCGICSPGLVVAAATLIADTEHELSRQEVEAGLAGNLCRCTGYRPIVEAVQLAASIWNSERGNR